VPSATRAAPAPTVLRGKRRGEHRESSDPTEWPGRHYRLPRRPAQTYGYPV